RDRNGGSRPIHALFVGDGPLRGMLEAEADPERVHFAGFRNQTELPACYAAADALVLPSDGRETWGLVANEAMACGLPVIVSEAAGCAPDLVREGETGFTVPLGDIEALAARLRDTAGLLTGVDARGVETVRRCVADAIERHSVEKATEGLERAMYARTRAAAA
ncbi:MAG: glycosyltransferase, partial [Rhodothermales bacterium]